MSSGQQLSELQLAIMRVLWDQREATVSDVHTVLRTERSLAPTTVATVLSRLEKRGLVTHRREGRQFVYSPTVTDEAVRQSAVDELADRVFQGDVPELVNHLLADREITPGDLRRVKALLESKERELREEDAPDE